VAVSQLAEVVVTVLVVIKAADGIKVEHGVRSLLVSVRFYS
jgi:hypothetical protein